MKMGMLGRLLALGAGACLLSPVPLAQAMVFTPGSFSVTPSGAATYAIPIAVPPGTAGMEPKLALGYSSQGGNGLLGVGWSLSGLSAITRCPRTIAQDGVNGGVNYDANDRFCLDGQRLVAITGSNYSAAGTEYRTERESYTKIISYGSAGNGPEYFMAWTKSGQIIEYGSSADSRIEAQGKSTIRVWALKRVQDTKGNFLTASYEKDTANGAFYPIRIDYTGNGASATYASVRFDYEVRTDASPFYLAGSLIKTVKRLTNVKTYFGESLLVRDYRLNYEYGPDSGPSRLRTVTECDGGGSQCLAASSFVWQGPSSSAAYLPKATWSGGALAPRSAFLGDVNGDGFADLIYVNGANTSVYVKHSNGTAFGAAVAVTSDASGQTCGEFGCQSVASIAAVGDVNGDGRADILFADGYVALATGSGFAAKANWGAGALAPNSEFLGDVNGDGLADLIYVNGANTTVYVQYVNATGTAFNAAVALSSDASGQNCGEFGCPSVASIAAVGDVNGDGWTDILFANGTIALSTGSGFAAQANWGAGAAAARFLGDANGDGLADLVFTDGAGTNVYVQYSNGASFGGAAAVVGDASGQNCGESGCQSVASIVSVGDANGDGRADILFADGNAAPASAPLPNQIFTIDNGLGAATTIAYLPLTDSNVYAKDSDAVWPVRDLKTQGPLYVVRTVSIPSLVNGGNIATNYFYTGAKAHMRGGGFLGFRKTESTDANGIKSATTFRQDYPYQGMPAVAEKLQPNGTWISRVVNIFTDNPAYNALPYTFTYASGKYHRSDLNQSQEQNRDLNGATMHTVVTTNAFDAYGNATSITVATTDGFSKTTTNIFDNDTTNWFLGRLRRSTVASTAPDTPVPPPLAGNSSDPPPPAPPPVGSIDVATLMAILQIILD